MKLSQLLEPIHVDNIQGLSVSNSRLCPDPEIFSIHYRSQDVRPGSLFVAISGHKSDGHNYIQDALDRGATAVVVQKMPEAASGIFIKTPNSRKALGSLSAHFYGHPSKDMTIVGITGTNGKTTTSLIIESIFKQAGLKTGVIGTIDYHYDGQTFDNPVTTPDSLDLQRILAQMREAGVTHVVMEVSSHAIDLGRINGCYLDVGVFTNLTQDHLDYHKTMDEYWDCKKRLFTEHLNFGPKIGKSVINCDDDRGKQLSQNLNGKCLTVGDYQGNMIWSKNFEYGPEGMNGTIYTPFGEFFVRSNLIGKHNLSNILCGVGVGAALNLPLDALKNGIKYLSSVSGRLEFVRNGKKPKASVYVDYAHTPDALENVLSAIRPLTSGRVICVFGCGGDRDAKKRPQMGEIAARLSDLALITSDNPRTEPPQTIIEHILAGTQKNNSIQYSADHIAKKGFDRPGYAVEPDRRKAIGLGIAAAQKGDIVLIAGKGHETYQIIGHETFPFNDRLEARKALEIYDAV